MRFANRTYWTLPFAFTLLALFSGCSGLSSRAKEMVGVYYQPTVSENEPVMELEDNGSCVLHAIKPGVLSYTVRGEWNVEGDSLIITTDGTVDRVKGDTTVVRIGTIPSNISYAIADYNVLSLTLTRDGNDYVYVRRGHNSELDGSSETSSENP